MKYIDWMLNTQVSVSISTFKGSNYRPILVTFFICLWLVQFFSYIYFSKFVLVHCAQVVAIRQFDWNRGQGNRELCQNIMEMHGNFDKLKT